MQNGLLTLDLANVKSAAVSMVLVSLGALLLYIVGLGSIFDFNWHIAINAVIMAGAGSLIKNFFTTNDGKFLGITQTVSN